MSGHHGPPDLDAQKDAQRPFTTDPHSPLGPLLPPPGGRHQERPHPGSPTPSPTPGHPPWVSHPITHPITPSGSPTPGRPPRVTHPVTHPITHPITPPGSPTLGQPCHPPHHPPCHPPHHTPRVTCPGGQHQERLHPRSPTLGSTLLPAGQVSCGFSETQRRGARAGSRLRDAYPLGPQSPAPRAPWLHVPHGSTCPTAGPGLGSAPWTTWEHRS